jgi:hypothetical protein
VFLDVLFIYISNEMWGGEAQIWHLNCQLRQTIIPKIIIMNTYQLVSIYCSYENMLVLPFLV